MLRLASSPPDEAAPIPQVFVEFKDIKSLQILGNAAT
jgi:hypothetical protein